MFQLGSKSIFEATVFCFAQARGCKPPLVSCAHLIFGQFTRVGTSTREGGSRQTEAGDSRLTPNQRVRERKCDRDRDRESRREYKRERSARIEGEAGVIPAQSHPLGPLTTHHLPLLLKFLINNNNWIFINKFLDYPLIIDWKKF